MNKTNLSILTGEIYGRPQLYKKDGNSSVYFTLLVTHKSEWKSHIDCRIGNQKLMNLFLDKCKTGMCIQIVGSISTTFAKQDSSIKPVKKTTVEVNSFSEVIDYDQESN